MFKTFALLTLTSAAFGLGGWLLAAPVATVAMLAGSYLGGDDEE